MQYVVEIACYYRSGNEGIQDSGVSRKTLPANIKFNDAEHRY